MIALFEYQNKADFPLEEYLELETFLDEIWNNRERSAYYYSEDDAREHEQRFIQFLHKDSKLKSNKYVGVIHFKGHSIQLLPKIFYEAKDAISEVQIQIINQHLLWWLGYCTKIKFPNYQTTLAAETGDLFEILIYLFSTYTRTTLHSHAYQRYVEVERESSHVKGRIDFDAYARQNLSTGRHQYLTCVYDTFEIDNEFNQAVKYVSKLLLGQTKNAESRNNLNEILFLLDEVSDVRISAVSCRNLNFNQMFADLEMVRDYCTLFLENTISFHYRDDLKLFAFLLPMEYVFEDFLRNFIRREVHGAVVSKARESLDKKGNFCLDPDYIVEVNGQKLIADAKYKMVYAMQHDAKGGISQPDLYQMIGYAIRYGVREVKLFYPQSLLSSTGESAEHHHLQIEDVLAGGQEIDIKSYRLNVIDSEYYRMQVERQWTESVAVLTRRLREELEFAFGTRPEC